MTDGVILFFCTVIFIFTRNCMAMTDEDGIGAFTSRGDYFFHIPHVTVDSEHLERGENILNSSIHVYCMF